MAVGRAPILGVNPHTISRIKTRRKRKRKEIYEKSIVLKYIKVKRSKLNYTKIYII